MTKRYLIAVLMAVVSGLVTAAEVYKSVDEAGNVTYSAEPPEDSVKVENVKVAPGPSEESIKKAQESHEKTKQTANAIAKENKELDAKRAAAEAEEAKNQETTETEVYRHQNTIRNHPGVIPPRPVQPIAPPPVQHPRPVQLPSR